jgi:class 3 adenylate cyclase
MSEAFELMGDAINLASWMETTAEPGTVQITGGAYYILPL